MLQANTISELLQIRAELTPSSVAYQILDEQGGWKPVQWFEFYQDVMELAQGLRVTGLEKGQVVGIMSHTCYQWELAHMAVLSLGGIVVGLDPNELPEQLKHITETSNIEFLFVDDIERLDKFTDETVIAQFHLIISFNKFHAHAQRSSRNTLYYLKDLLVSHQKNRLPKLSDNVNPADLATIIFTSGTTGVAKGIAYNHHQIMLAYQSIINAFPDFNESYRFACWLPLSNLFQRIVNLCAMGQGSKTYFVENPKMIIELLPQISPHVFIAVPRFFEKLYQGFETELARQPRCRVSLMRFVLRQAETHGVYGAFFKKITILLVKPFKAMFGHNLRYMISGSAPIPVWLLKRFDAMGLRILEAYGMSECVVPIAANRQNDFRFGSVGKPMMGIVLKLSQDNELLVKGEGLFSAYLKPDKVNTLDKDGFYASGDFAEFDSQGYLRLTGRKSEVFKTSTGRKIAPSEIEALINQIPGIDQSAIFGESKKYLIAIVTLTEPEESKMMIQQIPERIRRKMQSIPHYKIPAGFILSQQAFSLEKNEITANMKLKRKNIQQNYAAPIEQLYAELENPQSEIHNKPIHINQKTMLFEL